jgi:hypothetical protein
MSETKVFEVFSTSSYSHATIMDFYYSAAIDVSSLRPSLLKTNILVLLKKAEETSHLIVNVGKVPV